MDDGTWPRWSGAPGASRWTCGGPGHVVRGGSGGKAMYLWRAVDAEGEVLDVLVQPKRDKRAAQKLMRKLLKKQGMAPDAWVTDKCPAYGAALRELKLNRAAHV